MQVTPSTERAPKRPDGRGKHLWHALRKAGHVHRLTRYPTTVDAGVAALFPWPVVGYPGARTGMVQILQGRVTERAIARWRAGQRKAPQWALALLISALERRRSEIDHALELAKKEAGL